MDQEKIREILRRVKYPGFSRDIVSFGIVRGVEIEGDLVRVGLRVRTADPDVARRLKEDVEAALADAASGVRVEVAVEVEEVRAAPGAALPEPTPIGGVRHVVAVASGKGGVGKSTVSANLACALGARGHRVGLCDCDIYGPSIALMFGVRDPVMATADHRILPVTGHGIRLMSMGLLLEDGTPAILRGPMVTRFTQQFLRDVEWGELDYLILDLPPGTGDVQLTIMQNVALSGAVVVTTPQEVALIDARKAVGMFGKMNVRVLGIAENMSYFVCPGQETRHHLFGDGGGRREAERLGVELLAEVPLEIGVRESGDAGRPAVLAQPAGAAARAFFEMAERIEKILS